MNRVAQLEQQLLQSEERRKEEEKKRAIAEGKHRHLENQLKQQSPFKYANLKGKKGPPAHMPDIAEGREMQQGIQTVPGGMIDSVRSPSVCTFIHTYIYDTYICTYVLTYMYTYINFMYACPRTQFFHALYPVNCCPL